MTRGQFRYSSEAGAALGMPGVAPYISLGLGYRRNSTDFSHPENYATFDNYCEPEPARPAGRGEFLTNTTVDVLLSLRLFCRQVRRGLLRAARR